MYFLTCHHVLALRHCCSHSCLYRENVNDFFFFHLSDAKPTVTILKIPDHDEIYTNISVSFTCHINIFSGWEFLWFKDGHKLAETASNHTITSVWPGHSGSYQCQVKRGDTMVFESTRSQSAKLHVHGLCM